MIRFERAEEKHIIEISPLIREIDRVEIWRAAHITPEESIRLGLQSEAYAAYFDDDLACIIGCRPVTLLGGVACPWMLATKTIEKKPMTFLKHCKPVIEFWSEKYDRLVNYADNENDLVKKWVGWLGFTVHKPEPYGIDGALFCRFERGKNV